MADDAGDTPGEDPAVTSVPPAQTMAAAPAPAGFGERPATRGDTPAANSDAADIPSEAEQQLVADMVNNPMLDKVQKILVETLGFGHLHLDSCSTLLQARAKGKSRTF